MEEAEESEEDDDKEMGSDKAGGEAEVQAEMGATPPLMQLAIQRLLSTSRMRAEGERMRSDNWARRYHQ